MRFPHRDDLALKPRNVVVSTAHLHLELEAPLPASSKLYLRIVTKPVRAVNGRHDASRPVMFVQHVNCSRGYVHNVLLLVRRLLQLRSEGLFPILAAERSQVARERLQGPLVGALIERKREPAFLQHIQQQDCIVVPILLPVVIARLNVSFSFSFSFI